MRIKIKFSNFLKFATISFVIIILCGIGIIGVYYLRLSPTSKLMFRAYMRYSPFNFSNIDGYFQYHEWKCDTLFKAKNGNKFILAFRPNFSPRYSESFITDSFGKLSQCSATIQNGKVIKPDINRISGYFPNVGIDTIAFLYANAEWTWDTEKENNFKILPKDSSVILINSFWHDSIEISRVGNKLSTKILKENLKLYD